MSTLEARMRQRRGTAEEWETENPTLGLGEIGLVTDLVTGPGPSSWMRVKVGDGETAWNSLPWLNLGNLADLVQLVAGGAVIASTVLWVDAVAGSDETGERGNPSRPFATIWGADQEAENYDTIIVVGSGSHDLGEPSVSTTWTMGHHLTVIAEGCQLNGDIDASNRQLYLTCKNFGNLTCIAGEVIVRVDYMGNITSMGTPLTVHGDCGAVYLEGSHNVYFRNGKCNTLTVVASAYIYINARDYRFGDNYSEQPYAINIASASAGVGLLMERVTFLPYAPEYSITSSGAATATLYNCVGTAVVDPNVTVLGHGNQLGPGTAVEAFTDLVDVPNDYAGHNGEVLIVNNDEDGLEFGPTLGSAASQDVSYFDPAGAANTAESNANAYTDTEIATLESYIESTLEGLFWKSPVITVATGNVTLSGVQTINGVSSGTNQRILLPAQTDPKENGIWISSAGAWARAGDANTGWELWGSAVMVHPCTSYPQGAHFVNNNNTEPTIGVDNITFVLFSSGVFLSADGTTIENASNVLRVKDAGVSLAKMANIGQYQIYTRTSSGSGAPQLVTSNSFVVNTLLQQSTPGGWRSSLGLGTFAELSILDALGENVTQASHGFVVGDIIIWNGTQYSKASRSAVDSCVAAGVVVAVLTTSTFIRATLGRYEHIGHGITVGKPFYLAATSGAITESFPTSGFVVTLGYAITNKDLFFFPGRPYDSRLAALAPASANGVSLINAANYAAMRTLLGLDIGSNVQAYSSVLSTLAGASANGQSLITAANYAAMRTLLGLVIGTNVQAYSSVLDTLAGASPNGQSLITAANYAAMRALLGSGTPDASNFLRGDGTWQKGEITVKLGGDETRTGVTTISPSALVVPLAAGQTITFCMRLWYHNTGTGGLRIRTYGPASPSIVEIARNGVQPAGTGFAGRDGGYSAVDLTFSSSADERGYIEYNGFIVNGANAGDFGVSWAQSSANGTTTMRGRSEIKYTID